MKNISLAFVSDSHGVFSALERTAKIIRALPEIEMIYHLGDYASDAEELSAQTGLPCEAVRGNCDFPPKAPNELVVSHNGVTIYLTHGHRSHVKWDRDTISLDAKAYGASICVYGHTHVQAQEYRAGVLCINPGSIALPRVGDPSFAVLCISPQGNVNVSFYAINKEMD